MKKFIINFIINKQFINDEKIRNIKMWKVYKFQLNDKIFYFYICMTLYRKHWIIGETMQQNVKDFETLINW